MKNCDVIDNWVTANLSGVDITKRGNNVHAINNILYSYRTPIAKYDKICQSFIYTSKSFSRTTTKHKSYLLRSLNKHAKDRDNLEVDQMKLETWNV